MKMVEKAAKAIYDKPTTFDGDTIATHLSQSMMIDGSATNADELRKIVRSVCRDAAIAVLKAMRLPDDAECVVGGMAIEDAMFGEGETVFHGAVKCWNAMLDNYAAEAEAQKEEER